MTPNEIALVREGFAMIAPDAERIGVAVYERLFQADPSLRALFGSDMRVHARNLMGALTMAVGALDDPEPMLAKVQALGARHAAYGVVERDIATAGSVLLATLDAELGAALTPAAFAAWARAYGILADAMMAGMQEARRKAA